MRTFASGFWCAFQQKRIRHIIAISHFKGTLGMRTFASVLQLPSLNQGLGGKLLTTGLVIEVTECCPNAVRQKDDT